MFLFLTILVVYNPSRFNRFKIFETYDAIDMNFRANFSKFNESDLILYKVLFYFIMKVPKLGA